MESLLTTEDIAEWLRLDVVTVRRLINRGELPAYRVAGEYRFRRDELERFLEGQRVAPSEGSIKRLFTLKDRSRDRTTTSVVGAFDRFTDRARNVLVLAQDEAASLNHNYLGTEHLLLGLIREQEGIAAQALIGLGVRIEDLRTAVEQRVGAGQATEAPKGQNGLTPRTKKVLELAVAETQRLHHDYVGTEHLLLGLAQEGEGIAARILTDLGFELKAVKDAVEHVLERASRTR